MDVESDRVIAARRKMCTPCRRLVAMSGVVIIAVFAFASWSTRTFHVQTFYHNLQVQILLQQQPKSLPIFALYLTGGSAVANVDWKYRNQACVPSPTLAAHAV